MTRYRTQVVRASRDNAMIGQCYVWRFGRWAWIGETKRFYAGPAIVRARSAATGLCRRHAAHHGVTGFAIEKE